MTSPTASLSLRDPASFAAIYREHAPDALRAATSILRDRHAAEDVVQDVFCALWRDPGGYAPERGSLATYVRLVARSRALDALRARRSAANAAASTADVLGRGRHAAEPAADVAERRAVLRAVADELGRLPRAQRTAVVLHHVHGLSDRELADATGVALGTAKSRIRLGTRRARMGGARVAA
jgi:RNA polymerase sigma-70 factor (ECF subfamily)